MFYFHLRQCYPPPVYTGDPCPNRPHVASQILLFNQQRSSCWAEKYVVMVVMSGANESGHADAATCHLSPVIRHESWRTFEGSQRCKAPSSWKDSQRGLPGKLLIYLFLFFSLDLCVPLHVCVNECKKPFFTVCDRWMHNFNMNRLYFF